MQDSATYDKISHNYPNIVEARQSCSESAEWKKFVNPYVLCNVEQSHPEEVLSCFALKRGLEDVALYFIFREYVVEGPVKKSVTGTGRFIYENIVGKEDLTAIAFAEEPPEGNVFRPQSDTWQEHLEYQFYKLDRSYYSEDGYKDMSTFNKIRLCELVFRSRLYREKVEFVPQEENIEPGLVRRAVEFIYHPNIREDKVSDVWMIPCKVEYLPRKVSINRYIVRGDEQFFICGDTQNKGFTFVEGYMQKHKAIMPVYL